MFASTLFKSYILNGIQTREKGPFRRPTEKFVKGEASHVRACIYQIKLFNKRSHLLCYSNVFAQMFHSWFVTFQVGCKASLVFFHYCVMANFYWLLVEGLYLHILLTVTFSPNSHFIVYLLIGWGKKINTVFSLH